MNSSLRPLAAALLLQTFSFLPLGKLRTFLLKVVFRMVLRSRLILLSSFLRLLCELSFLMGAWAVMI